MNTTLPILLTLLALLSASPRLQANGVAPNTRILPPGIHTGEFIGEGGRAIPAANGRIVVGSPNAIRNVNGTPVQTGGVYVFDSKSHQLIRTIFPSDGVAGGRFGESVAVSGNVMVVGSPNWGTSIVSNRGAVYLYNVTTGALIRRIEPSNTNAGDLWGKSVAIEGDTLAYGARDHDGNTLGSNMGVVETYSILRQTQMASIQGVPMFGGRPSLNQLGASIAINRGVVAAGAPGSTGGDGAVLLFDAVSGSVIHTLQDPKGAGKAGGFGYSLDMDDGLLIVGAPFHSIVFIGPQPNAGSAYLFDMRYITTPQAVIGAVDGGGNQILGTSVATRNGVSAVGIPGVDYTPPGPGLGAPVTDYGNVLVLDHRMRELDRLSMPTLGTGARYGTTVGVTAEGHVLAGAPGDDSAGADSGAIWKAGPYKHNASGMYQIHAMTKTGALQNSAAVFSNFTELTASGLVSFTATMSGPGTSGGKNSGLWSTLQSGLGPAPVALANVPIDHGMPPHPFTVTGKKVFRPICNSGSELFLRMTDSRGVVTQYYDDRYVTNGFLTIIDNSTQTYASLDGVAVKSLGETWVPFSGGLTCAIPLKLRPGTGTTPVTATSDSAIYTQPNFYVREGIDNVPMPATGKYGEFVRSISYADPAHCYYRGFIQDTAVTAGIFADHTATLVVRESLAPDATGAVNASSPQYSSFLGISGLKGSMARTYLYRATLKTDATKGVNATNNEALYANIDSTGSKLIARKDDTIPGTSLKWNRFLDYGITSQGTVLVLATLSGSGVNASNDTALIAHVSRFPLPDATLVLLREGDFLPDGDGARVAAFNRLDMAFTRTTSSYGVLVTLRTETGGATAANNLVWVTGNIHQGNSDVITLYSPHVAFRKGAAISAQAGRDTIASISVPSLFRDTSSAGNTGLQHAVFNNTGLPSSVLVITFPDKGRAIVQR